MDLTDFRSCEAFFKPVSGFKTSVKKSITAAKLKSRASPQLSHGDTDTFKEKQKSRDETCRHGKRLKCCDAVDGVTVRGLPYALMYEHTEFLRGQLSDRCGARHIERSHVVTVSWSLGVDVQTQ